MHYISIDMGQLQASMGGRANIIDMAIVPITVMLLVVVINYFMNMQHGSVDGSVENSSHTHITEQHLDASDGGTPTKLYWKDGSEAWYLQALQQPKDNSVIIAANLAHAFSINTAAVFNKTKKELLQYTLSNYGIYGNLTVDPTSGINETTYKVTIFENQQLYPPSVFTDFDNGKIKIVSGPNDHELPYPLYLTVDTSSYIVMATNDSSKATEFHLDLTTFSKTCPP